MTYYDATFQNFTGTVVDSLSSTNKIVLANDDFGSGDTTYTVLNGTFTPGTVGDFSTYTGKIVSIDQVADNGAGGLGNIGVRITTDPSAQPELGDFFTTVGEVQAIVSAVEPWIEDATTGGSDGAPEYGDGTYLQGPNQLDGNGDPLTFLRVEGTGLPQQESDGLTGTITTFKHVDLNGDLVDPSHTTTFNPPVDTETFFLAMGDAEEGLSQLLLSGNDTIDSSFAGASDSVSLPNSPGNDTFKTGESLEGIGFWGSESGVNVNLAAGTINDDGLGGNDTIDSTNGSLDSVWGSDFNDVIVGSNAHESLAGGAGDDQISGGGGNDYISIQGGNDTVDPGAGNDWVTINPEYTDTGNPDPASTDIGANTVNNFDVNEDNIAVWDFDSVGVNSSSDLEVTEVNGDAVLSFPAASGVAGTITLDGVSQSEWEAVAACFPAGTLIETRDGPRAIETLAEGDEILTSDGFAPALWLGKSTIEPHPERGHADMNKPVIISAGAFGPGAPARDLVSSWWHGVMVQGPWVQSWFGASRVIVPIGLLVNGSTIRHVETDETLVYYNVLVEGHAVMFAEGLAVETFRPINGNHVVFDNHTEFAGFRASAQKLAERFAPRHAMVWTETEGRFIAANLERLRGCQLTAELLGRASAA